MGLTSLSSFFLSFLFIGGWIGKDGGFSFWKNVYIYLYTRRCNPIPGPIRPEQENVPCMISEFQGEMQFQLLFIE